nr:hypothetical protein [Paucisalibacillus globulus]
MLERYLVVIEEGEGHLTDDRVTMMELESSVREFVGKVAANNYSLHEAPQKIKRIYKVDLVYGRIHEVEPVLEDMKIVLKKKPTDGNQ